MIGSTLLFKEKFVLLINFIESKLEITKAQLSVQELTNLKCLRTLSILLDAPLFEASLLGAILRLVCSGYFFRIVCLRLYFVSATLFESTLFEATLFEATLFEATLFEATLFESTLFEATLFEATLFEATLFKATLFEANLLQAKLLEATFLG